jgi:hypothetical protein
MRLLALATLGWIALTGASDWPTKVSKVDPLTVQDDDFARHRDPAEWRGFSVERLEFKEERAAWRLWRIVNVRHRKGPLWFVPHDNENGGFEAAFAALHKYGGTAVIVDSGVAPGHDGERLNKAVDYGRPVDPNRNFDSALPGYPARILAPLAHGAWPIIALHTNAPGFDTSQSLCNQGDPPGSGIISIRFCDEFYTPSQSKTRAWPFDDDDSVGFATYLTRGTPHDAFCNDQLVAADFNIVHERVVASDGSLSNYAVLHGLAYLNFETQDRGNTPEGLANMRDRLMYMIDHAIALCVPGVKAIPVSR